MSCKVEECLCPDHSGDDTPVAYGPGCPMCEMEAAARIGRAVLAGWGFASARGPRGKHDRGCVWVRVPGEEGWRAMKGSGKGWMAEALDEAGVPE